MSNELFHQQLKKQVEGLHHVYCPVVNKKRFSEMTGLSEDTIRGMMDRGYLPTKKIGRHRLINISKLIEEMLKE